METPESTFEGRADAPAAPRREGPSLTYWVWEWTKSLLIAVLLFLVIRSFLVEAFKIPTGSMEGTLLAGDFLLVNKLAYGADIPFSENRLPGYAQPVRGEVVVFLPPHEEGKSYVKRVVGIPGDTLEMRDKILYLNGQPQEEPYARRIDPITDPGDQRMQWQRRYLAGAAAGMDRYRPTRDNWGPLVVPEERYFALGDNRDNSEDSRHWGFLEGEAIRGRPLFVYYSFERNLHNPFSWLTSVRWSRIGDAIR